MAKSLLPFIWPVLGLYVVDALVEMSFISSMVWWLHRGSKGPFIVLGNGSGSQNSSFPLYGHPQHLLTDQGHTANGAGGTAVVLIGFGGVVALWLETRSRMKSGTSSPLFFLWAALVILSCLLTLVALIFTFVVTSITENQHISPVIASSLAESATATPTPYPIHDWTPETWFVAVLRLPLASDAARASIEHHMHIMRGWRYNLIPMFILSFVLADLVVLELVRRRRRRRNGGGSSSNEALPLREGLAAKR